MMIQESCLKNERYSYLLGCHVNFFNMLSEGIYIKNNKTIIFCNPEASRIFSGNSENKLKGKEVSNFLIPVDEHKVVYAQFMKSIEVQDEVAPTHIKMKRLCDDRELDLEISGINLVFNGNLNFIGVVRDITEIVQADIYKEEVEKSKKMLDEVKENERVKTEFFENLAHELRTPLNVILGIVQLQDQLYNNGNIQAARNSSRKYNDILKQNCYRLIRMVNNVLDMTKIDSGYLNLKLKNEDIISAVENITMSVVEYAATMGINIIFDTDVEEKLMAFDSEKMERIILNLLSNAVKFTPEGRNIFVCIEDMGDSVKIRIKDEGEGIPMEKQQFIFNRFIQLDNCCKKKATGTGIGLALVKSLVEAHGGNIEVISEVGVGSEFIITLPVRIVKESGRDNRLLNGENRNVEKVCIEFSDIYNVEL